MGMHLMGVYFMGVYCTSWACTVPHGRVLYFMSVYLIGIIGLNSEAWVRRLAKYAVQTEGRVLISRKGMRGVRPIIRRGAQH